jgi:AcrR family transcriptional regulator
LARPSLDQARGNGTSLNEPDLNKPGPDAQEDRRVEAPASAQETGEEETVQRKRGRPRKGKAVGRDLPRDEELLKIAAEVLYKKGFESARLDDIAREAGIVKGSLYHYFGSKDEIYERLVNNVRGRINFEEEIKGKAPAADRLSHLLRTRLETTVEYPLEVGLLARELVRMNGPAGEWAREDPKRYFVAIRQIIIQGQKERAFRPVDPDIMASVIFGILAHLPTWYRLGGRIRPDALVDEIAEFIMAGLAP